MRRSITVLLAVALPTPFKVVGEYDMRWAARGGTHRAATSIERNGFDGPLEVSLADKQARHLQGVTGPTITVPAGASEFDYTVTLPPWMETGRTCRVCVMAIGVVKERTAASTRSASARSTRTSNSSPSSSRAGWASSCDRTSLVAEPRPDRRRCRCRVARTKGLTGPVKVELVVPAHIQGVKAEPVEIAADRDKGSLTFAWPRAASGRLTCP